MIFSGKIFKLSTRKFDFSRFTFNFFPSSVHSFVQSKAIFTINLQKVTRLGPSSNFGRGFYFMSLRLRAVDFFTRKQL